MADRSAAAGDRLVLFVSLLTFLHHAAAQMRSPIIPLYAAAHGASATGVGLIVGAHMMAAAVGSIPFGRAADLWGRRPLLLGGMAAGGLMSLLLPLVEGELALTAIYGLAGLGIAAFTPSALAVVGDAVTPGRTGRAFAWYSTAHYGAIGAGPFLGGLAAQWWGLRAALIGSALGIGLAFVIGLAMPIGSAARGQPGPRGAMADIQRDPRVWAGWVVSVSGLLVQGVVFTFYPLLGQDAGLSPGSIGLVFLVLGIANTLARFPAGWLVDRTGRCSFYAVAGVIVASGATALLPQIERQWAVLLLVAVFGAVSGIAFVAVSAALTATTTSATRGLVMGGYSTSLYLGLAFGSFGFGPLITHLGYGVGFVAGGATGAIGALVAGLLWRIGAIAERGRTPRDEADRAP